MIDWRWNRPYALGMASGVFIAGAGIGGALIAGTGALAVLVLFDIVIAWFRQTHPTTKETPNA